MGADDRGDEPSDRSATRLKPPQGSGYVLVVDDEPVFLIAFASMVEKLGFAVRSSSDPAEAIKIAVAEPPLAIITDYEMPVTDGARLLETIRGQLGDATPRAILVTGHPLNTVDTGGFHTCLRKPPTASQLLVALADLDPDLGLPIEASTG